MGISLFFVFTGLQVTGGQWTYTLFTEGRSIAPAVAGMWVSIYRGSLTVGDPFGTELLVIGPSS